MLRLVTLRKREIDQIDSVIFIVLFQFRENRTKDLLYKLFL